MRFKFIIVLLVVWAVLGCEGEDNVQGFLESVGEEATYIQTQNQSTSLKKTGQTKSHEDYDDGYYQAGIAPSYTRDDSKEIVMDNITGLVWQDSSEVAESEYTFSEAYTYCKNLIFAEENDWELPTIDELYTIVDYGRSSPAMDPVFESVRSSYYWSATTRASYSSYAWVVYFSYGNDGNDDKSHSYYVRCVRQE